MMLRARRGFPMDQEHISSDCDDEPPTTLPIARPQPEPISTQVIHLKQADGWQTVISRVFALGEGRNCRFCPAKMCGQVADHCMVCVPCYVPDHLAPTFPLFGNTGLAGPLPTNRVADNR